MDKAKRATIIICILGFICLIIGCFINEECANKLIAVGNSAIISSILTYLNLKWQRNK